MTAPIIDLTNAVVLAINAYGKAMTRRYVHFRSANDVALGQWFAMAATEEIVKKRLVDTVKYNVDIAYQRALPSGDDPLGNTAFLDACMEEVESVKALFREGCNIADEEFGANWVFLGMTNSPIYRPEMLLENQIFTSVIRLEFLAQLE